eukprot:15460189-Alexandrium_andersonii.AAC.1
MMGPGPLATTATPSPGRSRSLRRGASAGLRASRRAGSSRSPAQPRCRRPRGSASRARRRTGAP